MAESLGVSQETFSPDTLIAGSFPRVEKTVKIKTGSGIYVRGTLLGLISRELDTPVADGSNTGNGTMSAEAMKGKTENGVYKVIFTSATVFYLESPDGVRVGEGVVGTTFSNNHMTFLMTAGGTPWVDTDFFTIPIDDPAEDLWVKAESAFVDGSEDPDSILGADIDATSEAITSWAYRTGEFSENDLVYGAGHDADSVRAALDVKSIFLVDKTELNPLAP